MHYGKYVAHYLKNTFFFDANPPLGKMMVAFAGYLASFDGKFNFDKIGQEYTDNVPLWTLRYTGSTRTTYHFRLSGIQGVHGQHTT